MVDKILKDIGSSIRKMCNLQQNRCTKHSYPSYTTADALQQHRLWALLFNCIKELQVVVASTAELAQGTDRGKTSSARLFEHEGVAKPTKRRPLLIATFDGEGV